MTNNKEAKFTEVYQTLFPKMVNFAGRLCRNREEAEDITQEAFIKAYAAFETCDDERRIDNWLMKIVYNTFLDSRRKKSRRIKETSDNPLGNDLLIENQADFSNSPEEIYLKKSIDPRILRALKGLDKNSQEIFRLVYIEQVDQTTVSKRFGIKVAALRSRLHRICSKLRIEMGNKAQTIEN